MAGFADALIAGAQQAGNDIIANKTPDIGKSISEGVELAQHIQNVQQQRQQLEIRKQELQFMKHDKVAGLIEMGLTKVPRKVRKAFFNNVVIPQAGQAGINLQKDFYDAISSDDVNPGLVARDMLGFRDSIRTALRDPTPDNKEAAMQAIERVAPIYGGDYTALGGLLNQAYGTEAGALAQEQSARSTSQQRGIGNLGDLRKELTSNPVSKDSFVIAPSYEKIRNSVEKPSAAGDMVLIYNFMKMQDPGSTVREGEFKNAETTAGIPEQILNLRNKLLKGERLSDEQRKDFYNQAEAAYRSQFKRQADVNREFEKVAKSTGIDPGLIFAGTKLKQPPPEKQKGPLFDIAGRKLPKDAARAYYEAHPKRLESLDEKTKKALGF